MNDDDEEENAEWEKVGDPEFNVSFQLGGCQAGKTADVDGPVEPDIHSSNSDWPITIIAMMRPTV